VDVWGCTQGQRGGERQGGVGEGSDREGIDPGRRVEALGFSLSTDGKDEVGHGRRVWVGVFSRGNGRRGHTLGNGDRRRQAT